MEWLQLSISLAGIIGLILFLFYLMKKVSRKTAVINGSKLRILDRANVGRDSALLVVCVCGKLMVVGVSAGRIEKICDLPVTEEEYSGTGGNSNVTANPINFSDILTNMGLKRKKNNSDFMDEKEVPVEKGETRINENNEPFDKTE